MQSAQSIGRALYRIVFRGGTPQRIQFSTPLLLSTIGILLIGAVEIGLALFTLLSGLYIGAALLTRSVPRARLRASLLTVLLLLALAGLVFTLLIPLLIPPLGLDGRVVLITSLLVFVGVTSGATNAVHYARGGSRANAALITVAFAALLGAFYATLRWLLETVFS
jgi:hypothetical protein